MESFISMEGTAPVFFFGWMKSHEISFGHTEAGFICKYVKYEYDSCPAFITQWFPF